MKTLTELITPLLKVMPSPVPRRQERLRGQHALADGIKYVMPVNSDDSPVLMAAFPINKKAAAAILPGPELRPFSLGGKGLLVVVMQTSIGRAGRPKELGAGARDVVRRRAIAYRAQGRQVRNRRHGRA